MKVKIVTAYVPLQVRHLTGDQYRDYGRQLAAAVAEAHDDVTMTVFDNYPIERCWLTGWLEGRPYYPPATEVPADRYATPLHMVASNIVQHNRTDWAVQELTQDESVGAAADVYVWLDLAIMKQGGWTGKPVTAEVVTDFCNRLQRKRYLVDIPFPGIWDRGEISDTGANWRFCGSTHVWPARYLREIDQLYKFNCRRFIDGTRTIPLDLPIWAMTERSPLPFHWYAANHDATQLTNFPA